MTYRDGERALLALAHAYKPLVPACDDLALRESARCVRLVETDTHHANLKGKGRIAIEARVELLPVGGQLAGVVHVNCVARLDWPVAVATNRCSRHDDEAESYKEAHDMGVGEGSTMTSLIVT